MCAVLVGVPYTDGEGWTAGMGFPVKSAWHAWWAAILSHYPPPCVTLPDCCRTYTSIEGNTNQGRRCCYLVRTMYVCVCVCVYVCVCAVAGYATGYDVSGQGSGSGSGNGSFEFVTVKVLA